MKVGAFSISLNVKDIHKSKEFYEHLGFEVYAGDIKRNYLIMKNESTIIGLFEAILPENIITFNPGWDHNANKLENYNDIRDIQQQLKSKGIEIPNEVDESTSGPASFMIKDPDGNSILFDQHV